MLSHIAFTVRPDLRVVRQWLASYGVETSETATFAALVRLLHAMCIRRRRSTRIARLPQGPIAAVPSPPARKKSKYETGVYWVPKEVVEQFEELRRWAEREYQRPFKPSQFAPYLPYLFSSIQEHGRLPVLLPLSPFVGEAGKGELQ